MSQKLSWRTDVEDWDTVSVESYKFILEQAKERLDELIGEAHGTISRSLTLLIAYLTIFGALTGYIFSERNKPGFDNTLNLVTSLLVLSCLYIFTLLFSLIASKRYFYRGSPPADIFRQSVFEKVHPDCWHKLLLLIEVERIQNKIERIKTLNQKRFGQFRAVLKVSLIFLTLTVFALVRKMASYSL